MTRGDVWREALRRYNEAFKEKYHDEMQDDRPIPPGGFTWVSSAAFSTVYVKDFDVASSGEMEDA